MFGRKGELSPTFGRQLSDEQKEHLLHYGPRSEESRKKQRETVTGEGNHFFGKSHTPEALQKMREWQIGKKATDTQRAALLAAAKRPRSEETKQRMREAAKKRERLKRLAREEAAIAA